MNTEQEDLILEAVRLHQVPDWESLMEINITPALVIDGERRLHRRSLTAAKAVTKLPEQAPANP